jgi:hypothetical protein
VICFLFLVFVKEIVIMDTTTQNKDITMDIEAAVDNNLGIQIDHRDSVLLDLLPEDRHYLRKYRVLCNIRTSRLPKLRQMNTPGANLRMRLIADNEKSHGDETDPPLLEKHPSNQTELKTRNTFRFKNKLCSCLPKSRLILNTGT